MFPFPYGILSQIIPFSFQYLQPPINNLYQLPCHLNTFRTMPSNKLTPESSQRTVHVKKEQKMEKTIKKSKQFKHPLFEQYGHSAVKDELTKLVQYLSTNNSVGDTQLLEQWCEQNLKILCLLDIQPGIAILLQERYAHQKKTKEEQIKYILRKCFKYLKQKMSVNDTSICPSELEVKFFEEYFQKDDIDGEFEDINDIIPFRSKSTIKTMNNSYLRKVFKSRSFVQGFSDFLNHFDEIWDKENKLKNEKMVGQLVRLIQNNNIDVKTGKIKKFNRIPWMSNMKEKCKQLATSLRSYEENHDDQKRVKYSKYE